MPLLLPVLADSAAAAGPAGGRRVRPGCACIPTGTPTATATRWSATGDPVLECAATGVAPPAGLPEVVWRAGIDLNPLDVTDPADVAWLDALIWPEHAHRRARLRAAAAVAAAEPPLLVRGDLVDDLPALAAQAPAGATLVVFHTSVLYQVPGPRRAAFAAAVVRGCPGTGSRTRLQTCLRTTHCRRRRTGRCTTCSHWTELRSPGPGRTARRSPGSARIEPGTRNPEPGTRSTPSTRSVP